MAFIFLRLISLILCCFTSPCVADEYGDERGDGSYDGHQNYINGHSAPSLFQQQQVTDLCRNCVINHGVGFAAFPGQCASYIQCKFYGDIPTSMNIMQCPGGLYWNQNKLTCDWPESVQCIQFDNCPNQRPIPGEVTAYEVFSGTIWTRVPCPNGFTYNDVSCGCTDQYQEPTDYIARDNCDGYRPIVGDQTGYFQQTGSGWVRMPCPSTLIYNQAVCACISKSEETVTHRTVTVADQCRPKLQLLFDGTVRDMSDNKFWINNTGFTVQNGNGVFTGTSKLTIPGLSNVDFGQTLYVRVRFQQDSTNVMQTLIANGDCEVEPSVSMCSNSDLLQVSLQTSIQTNPTTLQEPQNVNRNQWQDVLFMVDDNQTQLLELPGNGQYPTPIQGSILRRPRGFVIGGGGSCEYFTGLIEQVQVFTCRPDYL